MKQLGVKFPDKQHLQIADLMEKTMAKQSQIVRAALQIGLKKIREDACADSAKALQTILIEETKAMN